MGASGKIAALLLLLAPGVFPCNLAAQTEQVFSLPKCGKLPVPLQMHGTAVVGDRIYIFGGEKFQVGWTADVLSAPIGSDAKIGEWRAEAPLPERLSYLTNGVEVVNDRIYLVGGYTSAAANTPETEMKKMHTVLWTRVGPNGVLEAWKRSTPWPGNTIALAASASTDKQLFITGGSVAPARTQVITADFDPTGDLINWRFTTPMPLPMWFHNSAILEKRLYLWGGLPDEKATRNPTGRVLSIEVTDQGLKAPWRDETAMSNPVYSASACGLNDYLVSVCGRYTNAYPTNVIWHSRMVNGVLQPWQMLKTDLETRVYHSLGLDKTNGWVFITGGRVKNQPGASESGAYVDAIQAFRLSQPQTAELTDAIVAADARKLSIMTGEMAPVLTQAGKYTKPVLTIFYSPQVPACRRFWDEVVKSPQFAEVGKRFVVNAVNISKPDGMQISTKYNVFRVPSVAIISANGELVRRSTRLSDWADLKEVIK